MEEMGADSMLIKFVKNLCKLFSNWNSYTVFIV